MSGEASVFRALWIGRRLSALERLSLRSFVDHGHRVELYSYGDVGGVPDGVVRRDAGEILPRARVFRYGREAGEGSGSFAAFANLFRYKLLHKRGGCWIDTDVICLRPIDIDMPYCFGFEVPGRINGAALRAPVGSMMIAELLDRATTIGERVRWGQTGPLLMTEMAIRHGVLDQALPPSAFYPLDYREAASLFATDPDGSLWSRLDGAYTLHAWNEMLRRARIRKNRRYPASSVFERLKSRHRIAAGWFERLLG